MLNYLPFDIVCEILAYLSVPNILRVRRVCKRLSGITRERALWCAVYERSNLLRYDGPVCSQSSSELEEALVRSTKLYLRWTGRPNAPPPISSCCLPDIYPKFSVEAALIAGRYLLTVEHMRLRLYDLDNAQLAREVFWEHGLTVTCGMLCYHARHDTVHVAFTQGDAITIVEIRLFDASADSTLIAEIPARSVVKMGLHNDYLFFAEERFALPPLSRLFHIPTRQLYNMSTHEQILDPFDMEDLRVNVTESHLLLLYSDAFGEACTCVEAYELPQDSLDGGKWLRRSHTGQFPLTTAAVEVLDCDRLGRSLSFFALAHDNSRYPPEPCLQAYLFEAVLSPSGKITFRSIASTPVDIDRSNLRQTKLFSSSRAGVCLAVSCTLGSSTYQTYHVQYGSQGERKIDVATLHPPAADDANRHVIGFDGFRGRLCWVRGWCPSKVHIIDYV